MRKSEHHRRHHDDEIADEVRIVCVPRFKTSGLRQSDRLLAEALEIARPQLRGLVLTEAWARRRQAAARRISRTEAELRRRARRRMDRAAIPVLDAWAGRNPCASETSAASTRADVSHGRSVE